MKKEELQRRVNEIKWFHSIPLPTDEGEIIVTPGHVNHCSPLLATLRFGLPENLNGKTVLDVGSWNGYFSFLSEQRGASVTALDILQGCSNMNHDIRGFKLAKEALKSNIKFVIGCLEDINCVAAGIPFEYDIVLHYGVVYHVKSPLTEFEYLYKFVKDGGYALVETAMSKGGDANRAYWEFVPGADNDATNFFVPTLGALHTTLRHVGFKSIEIIHITPDATRATVKAIK